MMKLFRKLHHIPSIILGLPILVICITGLILLFEEDVAKLQNPSLYSVEQGANPLPVEKLISIAESELGEDKKIASVTTDNATTPYLISINGSKWKYAINQYTGEVLGERKMSKFFMETMFLHRFFFDMPSAKGKLSIGKYIVGVSTIFCIIILISGLAIWIPKTMKALRNRLTISLTKGWRRFWYDTHIAGGFYITLVLLIICSTGLFWSFEWSREILLSIVTSPEREIAVNESANAAVQMVDGVAIIDGVNELPKSGHAIIKSIHTGTWGGLFSKWLYFVVMLVAISLPITGYWLWLKKKRAKVKRLNIN